MTLEDLLRTKVTVYSPSQEKDVEISPDFRIAVQYEDGNYVRIIVHPNGYSGETLDFLVFGNTLKPL